MDEKELVLKGTKKHINAIQVTPKFTNEELAIASSATEIDTTDCILIDVHGVMEFSDLEAGEFIEVEAYSIPVAEMNSIWYKASAACQITKHKGI